MCGIVGYITTNDGVFLGTKDKFIREALIVDTLRGSDSTGVMALTGDFTWNYVKNTVPGYEFISGKGFLERKDNFWCEVGHNRSATIGKVSVDNAHPFKQGDIILVHNGTLRDETELPHQNIKIEVDSELIAYNLNKEAPEDAKKVLEQIAGAFALVWFDARDQTVNFVRNEERPFHMGINNGGTAMWFGSDGSMLRMLVDRVDSAYAAPDQIYSLVALQHLKFKKGDLKPEVQEIKRHTYPVAKSRQRIDENWYATEEIRGKEPRNIGRHRNNNVVVNGVLRRIPEAHKMMLNSWYTTDTNDTMYFKQGHFLPWDKKGTIGAVYGKIYHKEWDCYFEAVLPNIRKKQLDDYGSGPWTVCAIGVDHTEINARNVGSISTNELTFICIVKWYSYTLVPPPIEEDEADTVTFEDADFILSELQEKQDEDTIDMVQGPNAHMISEEAFETLAQHGCSMCSAPILLADHWEVEWVGEMGNQPLCHSCFGYAMAGN